MKSFQLIIDIVDGLTSDLLEKNTLRIEAKNSRDILYDLSKHYGPCRGKMYDYYLFLTPDCLIARIQIQEVPHAN